MEFKPPSIKKIIAGVVIVGLGLTAAGKVLEGSNNRINSSISPIASPLIDKALQETNDYCAAQKKGCDFAQRSEIYKRITEGLLPDGTSPTPAPNSTVQPAATATQHTEQAPHIEKTQTERSNSGTLSDSDIRATAEVQCVAEGGCDAGQFIRKYEEIKYEDK